MIAISCVIHALMPRLLVLRTVSHVWLEETWLVEVVSAVARMI